MWRTKVIATLDKNSLLAKHCMLHSHKIDLESAEIVDDDDDYNDDW